MKNIAGYIFACAQDRPDVRLPAPIDAILRSCMPQFTAQTCPNITKNPPFRCRGKRRNDGLSWSDQRDLNPRPLDPQSSALPNCAMVRTVRKVPNMKHSIISTVFKHIVSESESHPFRRVWLRIFEGFPAIAPPEVHVGSVSKCPRFWRNVVLWHKRIE